MKFKTEHVTYNRGIYYEKLECIFYSASFEHYVSKIF